MNSRRLVVLCLLALAAVPAFGQPCPKVNTTTQTPATMRAIVKSVNCLVEMMPATSSGLAGAPLPRTADVRYTGANAASNTQVETLPIIGPQHSRTYPGFVLAILTMPVDNAQKSAVVTWDSPQASIRGSGGGECKIKLNSDRTVDAVCSQTGGSMFIVYR